MSKSNLLKFIKSKIQLPEYKTEGTNVYLFLIMTNISYAMGHSYDVLCVILGHSLIAGETCIVSNPESLGDSHESSIYTIVVLDG